jgi:NADP-dependent 3-hydroxy acid dehydrogenase YdfG
MCEGRACLVTGAGRGIVQTSLDTFGHLDVVVDNAGITRDKMAPRRSPT